jgi:hypothetical protein
MKAFKYLVFMIFLAGSATAQNQLLSTGDVGIGTTSPAFRLHVVNGTNSNSMELGGTSTVGFGLTGTNSGTYGLYAGVASTGRSWIQGGTHAGAAIAYDLILQGAGGYLGVGANAPYYKLQAQSADRGVALFHSTSTGNTGNLAIINAGNQNYGVFGVVSSGAAPTPDVFGLGYSSAANASFTNIINWTTGGRVGIGTSTPDEALTVKGQIHSYDVRVDAESEVVPDYVFEKDYDLLPLSEVEAYVRQNKHLPEVPSAKEMEAEGISLKEMNLLLLRKVEELTLHLIEQNKEIAQLKQHNASPDPLGKKVEELTLHLIEMKKENETMKTRLDKIEKR